MKITEKNTAFENRPTKSWNLKIGEEKRFREKRKSQSLVHKMLKEFLQAEGK